MKKLLSILIITVMLLSIAPFSFADHIIKFDHDITVSPPGVHGTYYNFYKSDPVNTLTFVAPETGDYYIYSSPFTNEGEYEVSPGYDPYCTMYNDKGEIICSSDDANGKDFGIRFSLDKGKKVIFKARNYDSFRSTYYRITLEKSVAASGLKPHKSKYTTYTGMSFYIDYNFMPLGAVAQKLTMTSSDETIVTVDDKNRAYAVGEGKAIITLKSVNGLTATVEVDVLPPKPISLDSIKTETAVNSTKYVFTAPETTYYDFKFESSEQSCFYIADINGNRIDEMNSTYETFTQYLVAGRKYIIGAYSSDEIKADYKVSVQKTERAKQFYIKAENGSVQPYELSSVITANSVHGYIDKVEWSVSDPSVATVTSIGDKEGEIAFKKAGTVVVSAKSGTLVAKTTVTGTKSSEIKADEEKEIEVSENKFDACYNFIPEKSGLYRVSAAYANIDINGISADGIVDTELVAGTSYTIALHSRVAEKTTLCVTALSTATELTLGNGETITGYMNEPVDIPLYLNGKFDAEMRLTAEGGKILNYNKIGAEALFDKAGEYTVTAEIGELSDNVKVIVKEIDTLEYGVKKQIKLTKQNPEFIADYLSKTDGYVSVKVSSDRDVIVDAGNVCGKIGKKLHGDIDCFSGNTERVAVRLASDDEATVTIEVTEPVFPYFKFPLFTNYILTLGDTKSLSDWFVCRPGNFREEVMLESKNQRIVKTNEYTYEDKVTGAGLGSASLRVVGETRGEQYIKVTVVDKNYDWASDITVTTPEICVGIGQSDYIKASAVANTKKTIGYVSLDPHVARVDQNGRVTGFAEGETKIAVSVDNIIEYVDVTVTVPEVKDSTKVFKDVKSGKWYTNAINYAYSYGFVAGTSENEFGRDTTVTRGMFITILARIAGVDTGKEANKTTTKFTDVKSGKYYTAAIKWANENGIVSGTGETTFSPESPISRQDLCVMLTNFTLYINLFFPGGKEDVEFKDVDKISDYAWHAVRACRLTGIVSGYSDGTFGPKKTATRAEAAQILYLYHSIMIAQ